MTDERKMSAMITASSPGDMMVEIVRSLMSRGAEVATMKLLESIFSGDTPIEDALLAMNNRGFMLKVTVCMDVPGGTEAGIIEPAITLGAGEEFITVQSGFLASMEAEPEGQIH